MKAIKNTISTTLVSMLLIISTSNMMAQDSYTKENNELQTVTLSYNSDVDFHAESKEPALLIENWMNSEDFWNQESAPLQIESWMNDANFWSNNEQQFLDIEDWMSDTNFWANSERQLKISAWMMDINYWDYENIEKHTEIEDWMLSANYWN